MTRTELEEASAILAQVLDGLLATARSRGIAASAELFSAVGALKAASSSLMKAAAIGAPVANCFDLAVAAGADLSAMTNVRNIASSFVPVGLPAEIMAQLCIRLALIAQSRIIAALDLKSRQDADAYLALMDGAFDAAEEYAADALDQAAYRAIVALHGAVSNDLQTRSRPLPRMVQFDMTASQPALFLAQRLYADASRAEELIAENKVVHPAFFPRSFRALSS